MLAMYLLWQNVIEKCNLLIGLPRKSSTNKDWISQRAKGTARKQFNKCIIFIGDYDPIWNLLGIHTSTTQESENSRFGLKHVFDFMNI